MKFEIKHRFTDEVLFTCELEASFDSESHAIQLGAAVKLAINSGANLESANLTRANLESANLTRANLESANLTRANLTRANLESANLTRANLTRANLESANLTRANLTRANLESANLTRANLLGANLTRANLESANLLGANLTRANLTPIRDDFWAVLCSAPSEVGALRAAIAEGRIDGSTYSGPCACLVGTLANARKTDVHSIAGLTPNADRPAERFFMGIKTGDTPDTNPFSKIALDWTDCWLSNMRAAFGPTESAKAAD